MPEWATVLRAVLAVIGAVALAWVLIALNRRTFRKLQERRTGIHFVYLERIITVVILIGCVLLGLSAFSGTASVLQTLLGGTAIVSAVVVFAAQDVLKDILAGMMISIHKPFEIGNRIVLEDGTAGIVADMTTRQVVIRGVDCLTHIVPNSRIAAMRIDNLSYQRQDKAAYFQFAVGYDTDMALAKRVIAEAVEESPFTVPGQESPDGAKTYAPVRFMRFADSALLLEVMVYFARDCATETVIDDINTRVREALLAAGIEIPYNYVNVVQH